MRWVALVVGGAAVGMGLMVGCGTLEAVTASNGTPAAEAGADADRDADPANEEPNGDAGPKVLSDAGVYDGPPDDGGILDSGCPSGRGPTMIALAFADAGSYCIDETEVTNGQYQIFINAGVDTNTQNAECSWNTNFKPNCGGANTTGPNQPVTCIDWCDAYAFCKWAGKRLCGKIGGHGANVDPSANAKT
jgi:hypothetical protein